MNSLLLSALALLGCVAPSPQEPAPAPKEEPKKEAPAKTSPEARELLRKAAQRQGTDGLVGGLAPVRFRAAFATVVLHPASGNKVQLSDDVESFALPVPGGKQGRMRSEVVVDGKRIILGHSGRSGWMWTKDLKTSEETLRDFRDPVKDAEDIRDIDARRRMHRLALRAFFLGEMADAALPVTLLPDETVTFPLGNGAEPRAVKCRVLERAADPAAGEPSLRLYLDEATLDPLAIRLPPAKEGEPAFLLTFSFDPQHLKDKEERRAKFPKGVRVPDWIEMFEIPPDPKEAPAVRIQAGLDALEIDPAKIPDALFDPPRR